MTRIEPYLVPDIKALFASRYAKMFAHSTDTSAVKVAKIRALTLLVSKENVQSMMREFKVSGTLIKRTI